ncbi:radical SAM protein [Anaeroselena agilis]|uniref:Radical SAM protein n=1 Tax=Anaeroselena agilis TaxID=3063788 RepID=A0ABU3NVU9_9FIRM|nr:radical SAM protein [Selenomonadales bacterium 4137-cl]
MKPFREVYNCDSVTINVTNQCNLRCTYCFEKDRPDGMITPENICKVMDIVYNRLDGDRVFMVNLFGGEPLLNWEAIKALILHIDKMHYVARVGITTNLTILTEEMIQMFDDYGVVLLVSMDGTKKAHDTGRCGTYDIVKENLLRLKDRGLAHAVEVRMTVTPENVRELHQGVCEVMDMGFDHIVPCLATDCEWDDEAKGVLAQEFEMVVQTYLKVLYDHTSKRNVGIKTVDDYLYSNLVPFTPDRLRCAIGTNRWCAIGVDGEVMPCHQFHTNQAFSDFSIGNIFEGVDDTLIADPPEFTVQEKCQGCIAMSVCKGGCQAQNFSTTGDFGDATDAYCETSKIMAGIVKRYQKAIVDSPNPRSRRLVQLRENLKLKHYFDTVVMETNILSPDFPVRMAHFQSQLKQMEKIILPSFWIYFVLKLYPVGAMIGGEDIGKPWVESPVHVAECGREY